jgi:HK97 family phage major capsid protein
MTGALTSATKLLIFGDFSRGFVVVDRVGMNVEVVNHLFGSTGYPNGQRGLLAWWRNCTVITTKTAFAYLETL